MIITIRVDEDDLSVEHRITETQIDQCQFNLLNHVVTDLRAKIALAREQRKKHESKISSPK